MLSAARNRGGRAVLMRGLGVLFGVLMAGCGIGGKPVDRAAREGVLILGNETEPKGLDPHTMLGVPESRILWALYEGLVILDTADLRPLPGVAQAWEISDDGLTYIFDLRRTARWSNGDPVTAHDFVYAWQRLLTPTLGGHYSFMLFCLKNAERYFNGEIEDFGAVGAQALDEYTLRVDLEYPTPYFLTMQVHFTWFPVHRASIDAHGAWDDPANPWTRPGNKVSNGPFRLAQWEPNRVLALERNEHYWDQHRVALNGLRFLPITNLQTMERRFRSGDIHMAFRMPPSKVAVYEAETPSRLRTNPLFANYFLRFNVQRAPFSDVRVRRALWHAIDRDMVCKAVLQAGQFPSVGLVPTGLEGYEGPISSGFDPETARQFLADAGYPGGDNFPTVTLLHSTLDVNREMAEALQAMWREHLGIRVQLESKEWKVYLESMMGLDFDVVTGGWYADYLDPMTFLEIFESHSGSNWTGWVNDEFDALVQRGRLERDPAARFAILRDAEAIAINEAPFAPIYQYVQSLLVSPQVQGWQPNLMAYLDYRQMAVHADVP